MPPLFSSISEVNPSKTQWALKVRLVRCYQVPVFQNNAFSLECVFHDREGDRIHGSIKKEQVMQRLKPILREGRIFAIKNMVVAENGMTFKTTKNKYKIIFIANTNVCEIFEDTFPNFMYEFKSFPALSNASDVVDETTLFDVIGRLVAIDSPQHKEIEGHPRKLIDIVLEDTENNRLPCTLWGDFVEKITAYVENVGKEPFIVILQMCRAKRFRGEIRVSNVYHITELIVNGDLDEVTEFRKRLVMEIDTPKTISNISSASTNTISEELSKNNIRTIEQISEDNQVGSFWVFAKIVGVESSREWSYLSCKKCPKKVTPVGDKFYCERCDRFDVTGNLRFKIHVRVVDNTGNAVFLLWDRECVGLIGKTALDLRVDVKEELSNSEKIPKEIEDLVDRKVLFKVQVRPNQIQGFFGTYTVMKVTIDPNAIEKYCGETFESQETDVFSKLKSADIEDIKEICSSEDEVTTPLKSTAKAMIPNDVLNDSTLKRSLIDEFSSTAPEKKMKSAIKQEKD